MNVRDQALGQELALYRSLCEHHIAKGTDVARWQDLLTRINDLDRHIENTPAMLTCLGDSFDRHMEEPEHILRARWMPIPT